MARRKVSPGNLDMFDGPPLPLSPAAREVLDAVHEPVDEARVARVRQRLVEEVSSERSEVRPAFPPEIVNARETGPTAGEDLEVLIWRVGHAGRSSASPIRSVSVAPLPSRLRPTHAHRLDASRVARRGEAPHGVPSDGA